MSVPAPVPPANRLLASLAPGEYEQLRPCLEAVSLAQASLLHDPGQPMAHVHFINRGVISLRAVVGKGNGIEVGLVGPEGMLGLAVLLGDGMTPFRAVVQVPCEALRMRADDFRARVEPGSLLHRRLLGYAGAFLTQVSQSVACNARHSVEQRCSRWLLVTRDRVEGDRFPLTQEFLADMLGVRRASVSEVARSLQDAGLIRYRRGQVTVLDRPGLEGAACECYRVVKATFDRLLTSR